jgi:hypothetical protein
MNVVPSSLILVTLMKEALSSSKMSVLTRATRCNVPEDTILHSHRRENLNSYINNFCLFKLNYEYIVQNTICQGEWKLFFFSSCLLEYRIDMCLVIVIYPVYRPYIIVDKGKPLVKQHHISELIQGVRNFQDFLNEGIFWLNFWFCLQWMANLVVCLHHVLLEAC